MQRTRQQTVRPNKHLISLSGGYASAHMRDDLFSCLNKHAHSWSLDGSYVWHVRKNTISLDAAVSKGDMVSERSMRHFKSLLYVAINSHIGWAYRIPVFLSTRLRMRVGCNFWFQEFIRSYIPSDEERGNGYFVYDFIHPSVSLEIEGIVTNRQKISIAGDFSLLTWGYGYEEYSLRKEWRFQGASDFRYISADIRYSFTPIRRLSFFIKYQFRYLVSSDFLPLTIASDGITGGVQLQLFSKGKEWNDE